MNGRERMETTLKFMRPDRIPHFEVMFEIEQEAFGMSFPKITDWQDMSDEERVQATNKCLDIYDELIHNYG